MGLQFVVDSIDALPDTVKGLYKQDGGKYRLDLEGYEDPTNLKSALEKERLAAKNAENASKGWRELGKTPEEIQQLLAAHEKAEREKLEKGGEWDKLKNQLTEQHQAALNKELEGKTALKTQLEKHLIDSAAVAAIAAASGSSELLLPHVKAKTKVIEENGEFVVRIIDAAGNPRINAKGEFLTVADLVGEMRQDAIYAPCFKAPNTSGSGAPNTNGSGRIQDFSQLSSREKMNAGRNKTKG